MADSTSPTGVAASRPKRSFFKKPSWKQNAGDAGDADNDDPTAMFDGSKQTFSAIMKERERVRTKELQELEEDALRSKLAAARQGKRRKTAHDDEYRLGTSGVRAPSRRAKDEASISPSATSGLHSPNCQSNVSAEQSSSPHPSGLSPVTDSHPLSARYESGARAFGTKISPPVVIDLGDTDSDDNAILSAGIAQKHAGSATPADSDEEIDESDPEIREIMQETRRKQKLIRRQISARATSTESEDWHKAGPEVATSGSTLTSVPLPDPPVQIFITSRISNTRPLIVTRKLSQRLKEVRQAWCNRQGFDPQMTESVFFTFKGRRLFDVATCKSLGLVADAFGQVHMKDCPNWDENDGKITIEAVTPDIFKENAEEVRRQREHQPALKAEPEPAQRRTKIIIRTKDFGDAKFTCGSETTFEKLATTSTYRLKVPAGKRPYLLFDGERLDPRGTMADLDEFEDGDVIEMHFD